MLRLGGAAAIAAYQQFSTAGEYLCTNGSGAAELRFQRG
jgi:hypothetical protein